MSTVDVGKILDEGPWSGYQKLLVLATALAIILDGVDNQLLALAIPSLMQEWGIPNRSAFVPVVATSLIGMMVGGAIGGVIGDRRGRRPALLLSTLVFGVLTGATAMVDDVVSLATMRFLAGLGLGGAIPNAAALASEYVPRRRRAFAVTLTVVCVPLGGTLAGVIGNQVIPVYGWASMFVVGGVLPVLLFAILWKALPESPRFMARQRRRWPELVGLLRRLGHALPSGEVAFADTAESGGEKASMRDLVTPEYRRDTIAISVAFFFCLLSAYMGFNWIPGMLAQSGVEAAIARNGVVAFNVGGAIGAILGALAIQRIGSRVTMLVMSGGAVVASVGLATTTIGPELSAATLLGMLGGIGAFINGVPTTMYALAAHVYPTAIRATGVGTAVGVGRVGGVVSSLTGSVGGPATFFGILAAAMACVLASLAAVRRHIPRTAGDAGAGYAVQTARR